MFTGRIFIGTAIFLYGQDVPEETQEMEKCIRK